MQKHEIIGQAIQLRTVQHKTFFVVCNCWTFHVQLQIYRYDISMLILFFLPFYCQKTYWDSSPIKHVGIYSFEPYKMVPIIKENKHFYSKVKYTAL